MLSNLVTSHLCLMLYTASLVGCQLSSSRASMPVDCTGCNHDVLNEIQQLRAEYQLMSSEFQQLKESILQCPQPAVREGDGLLGVPTLVRVLHGSNPVTVLELLGQELFVLRRTVAQVLVYDTISLRLKRRIPVPGLGEAAFGMAVCDVNNYLYISDHWNHQIHVIDLSDDSIAARWTVGDKPVGLSVTANQNVLVAYNFVQKIEEYTPTGTLVRELAINVVTTRAIELDSGTWLVASAGPVHGITAMRKNGQVIASYGSQPGSADGQISYPWSLSADKSNGRAVFSDHYNHRVLLLNSSLSAARVFPLPVNVGSLTSPLGLVMDYSRGRLYVGEEQGRRRILVFDNATDAMFN